MRRRRLFTVLSLGGSVVCASLLLAATVTTSSTGAIASADTTTTTTTVPPNLAAVHVKLLPFASGLDLPDALAWRAGDNRMYVAQQSGSVVIVDKGKIVKKVLSLTVSHGSEQGLLGLAFSHDGTKMYVDFTDVNGDTHVVEWTMAGDHPDLTKRRQLLFQKQPFPNHNGGEVMIGPDNMLYIGFGDGGGAGDPSGNGQKLSTLLGKILRIDPRPNGTAPYTIPPNNPFLHTAGARPEIWMYGLRNPWRFSIDRVTRDTWIGDVGQALYEEIDYAAAGQSGINWGWNKREGLHPYNGGAEPAGARDPLLERAHTLGDCAITGGYVYRAHSIPGLTGAYVYGDFCTGDLHAVAQQNGAVTQSADLGLNVPQLTTFGEGPAGGLYAVSRAGNVFAIAPA